MSNVTKRVDHLRGVWHDFNRDDFGGKLKEPIFIITKGKKYDGKIYYRENRYGRPFDVHNLTIAISDRIFPDWALVYGTLLHEMVHQYQLQILEYNAPHDAVFNSIARHLEKKYDYYVR